MFSAGGRLWTAGMMFLIMPLALDRLGKDALGIWFLCTSLIVYFSIADIGMGPALAKFTSEYTALNDRKSLHVSINTGIVFYFCLSATGLLLGFAFGDVFLRFIRTPDWLMHDARIMLRMSLIATASLVFSNAFRGVLIGLHRMYITNTIEIIISIPAMTGMLYALLSGKGLLGLAGVQMLQHCTETLFIAIFAIRSVPNFRLNPFNASRKAFNTLIGFGWKVSMPSIALIVQNQAERLLLARFLGPALVGLYGFGVKITDVWRTTFVPTYAAVLPAASAMNATDDTDRLELLYRRGARFVLGLVAPIGLWLFAVAPVIMSGWMGAGYGASIEALRFLAIGTTLYLSAGLANSIARGMGILKPDLAASAVMVTVQLTAGIGLGARYGFKGILTASVLALSLSALTAVVVFHKQCRWPIWKAIRRTYAPPLLLAGIASIPIGLYNHSRRSEIVWMGWNRSIGQLMVIGALETLLFAALYIGLIRLTGYITSEDVRSLRTAVKGARKIDSEPVELSAA
jgi:O-antigen/teichoic acid export membrane protein